MSRSTRRRRHGQHGQGLLEYSLILALVAVMVIAVLVAVGNRTQSALCNVSQGLGGSCLIPGGAGGVASLAWCQGGSLTTSTYDYPSGTVAATGCANSVVSLAVDGSGGVYADDAQNNRVLYFSPGSLTASRVYGQDSTGTNFASGAPNLGGISANSLSFPDGLALDAAGGLYVDDTFNYRVLYYPAGTVTASRVYGQISMSVGTMNGCNCFTPSASSFNGPVGLAVDSAGGLYAGDANNYRVLYFAAGSTAASQVWGQNGSFTTRVINYPSGSVTATGFTQVIGVAVDGSRGVYVADVNRVLFFPSGQYNTATRVYGQGASGTNFATNMTCCQPPAGTTTLFNVRMVALDAGGDLYVADYGENRVLYYAPGSVSATRVYGQNGSFTSAMAGTDASTLSGPTGAAFDGRGNLYISSYERILEYTLQ